MVHNDGLCAHINVTCALSNSTSSRYVNPENDSDERRVETSMARVQAPGNGCERDGASQGK